MTITARRGLSALFGMLLVCGLAPRVHAQQGTTVSGTLTNTLSKETVAGATVRLEELGREVTSGKDGTFAITNVPAGHYHLLVRAQGYTNSRTEIDVASAVLSVNRDIDPELHFTDVVSVTGELRNQFDVLQPTNVLAGQELDKERGSTLGDTLQYEPGIAMRSSGPGPARPVIRGLDGDRVLILTDGQRMGDISSQSADHGVNVNPASADRIEIVRGPATLLYGGNAIGGLVNVITNDIPTAAVRGAHGGVSLDAGSAAGEAGGGADITAGNGNLAFHLTASGRRAGNYKTPEGEVPNSFSRSGAVDFGLAYTGQNGYFGGSIGYDRSHYGIPLVEEGTTNLDPRRIVFNLRGERRMATGFISGVRASLGVRRYRHDELAADEIVTEFKNDTTEFELKVNHRGGEKLRGTIGGWILGRAFDSAGEERLSPAVDQKSVAGFVYEEVTATPHVSFQFGGRIDHSSYEPKEDAIARTFNNVSGSVGLVVHPSDATTVAISLARASRNPALEELYNHGPHVGNFAFEIGDDELDSEKAIGFDIALRWRAARTSGEVAFFVNSITDYIFRRPTGLFDDDLPIIVFTPGDARLQGVESHIDVAVSRNVWIEGGLDYVKGELTGVGIPLPRMPPLRGRLGGRFQKNAFQAGIDGVFNAMQDRVFELAGVGEEPTDGSKLMKLYASYSFSGGGATNTITARLDNATDTLYRNHLNYLKDLVPEVGRNFKVLYSVRF